MVLAAAQMAPGGPVELVTVEVRAPGRGEVRIEMVAAALCHTDVMALYGGVAGHSMPTPVVVGHEGSGVVAELGPGVVELEVGQHVVLSLTAYDGTCEFCVAGHPALCLSARALANPTTGHGPALTVDGVPVTKFGNLGTFTEQMIVPQECVVAVDAAIPLDVACLIGCAVSTGVGVVRNTVAVGPGDIVVVIGCGGVGLNTIQGARLAGAAQVIAVDVSPAKLDAARTFGATLTVDATTEDVVAHVRAASDGFGAHYAFESTGLTQCMAQAVSAVRPGGTAVLLGMADATSSFVLDNIAEVIVQEKRITGTMMGSGIAARDFPRLVAEYLSGELMLDELVGRRRPLGEINEAIADLRAGRGLRTVFSIGQQNPG
jgi:S-(hydroxymethyl)glutathione dehydrogenase/alcohol dehydrogenase